MAYFTYRNRPVSKEKWARSESTEGDDIVDFVAVRYRLLFNAEQRIVDHKDQENSEMEVL
jgi:hypothetical protein